MLLNVSCTVMFGTQRYISGQYWKSPNMIKFKELLTTEGHDLLNTSASFMLSLNSSSKDCYVYLLWWTMDFGSIPFSHIQDVTTIYTSLVIFFSWIQNHLKSIILCSSNRNISYFPMASLFSSSHIKENVKGWTFYFKINRFSFHCLHNYT